MGSTALNGRHWKRPGLIVPRLTWRSMARAAEAGFFVSDGDDDVSGTAFRVHFDMDLVQNRQ